MATASELELPRPDAVADFLALHPPFSSLSAVERDEIADAAEVFTLTAGAVVVDSTTTPGARLWMVFTGQVALLQADDDGPAGLPNDLVNPGGIFGFSALLTGEPVRFTARTRAPTTLISMPGELIRPVFNRPAGVSYLAETVQTIFASSTGLGDRTPGHRPVGELLHAEPVLVTAETSVRDAVRQMTYARSSYALIPLPNGDYGIFTDRDLRSRVVGADVDVQAPIRTVMSFPAAVVDQDQPSSAVLMDMLAQGLRHMPVLDERGRAIGVVEDSDLIAAGTRRSFGLRRAIALASDRDELRAAAAGMQTLVTEVFRGGTDVLGTSGILSVVVDSLSRRALELALTEDGRFADFTPATFAWLTLGSVARRESMPSSDLDTAVSWAVQAAPDRERLLALATRVHEILDEVGVPADPHGAIAGRARFARSQPEWVSAAQGWMQDPLSDRGVIMSSLLVDGRVVWGDRSLYAVQQGYRRMHLDHPNALKLQLLEALSERARMRSLRDVLARRGGTVDLKAHAVTPVVNLARWGGLSVGVASATTPVRLRAAAGNGLLTDRDAEILEDVFIQLQRIRMTHQIDQIESGAAPSDVVAIAELTPLSRKTLADGIREIAAVQRRVAQHLSLGPATSR